MALEDAGETAISVDDRERSSMRDGSRAGDFPSGNAVCMNSSRAWARKGSASLSLSSIGMTTACASARRENAGCRRNKAMEMQKKQYTV